MRGNGAADLYAVRGTSIAEDIAPTNRQAYREASSYYRFLLTVAGDWVVDTTPYDEWLELPTAVAAAPPTHPRTHLPPRLPPHHQTWMGPPLLHGMFVFLQIIFKHKSSRTILCWSMLRKHSGRTGVTDGCESEKVHPEEAEGAHCRGTAGHSRPHCWRSQVYPQRWNFLR